MFLGFRCRTTTLQSVCRSHERPLLPAKAATADIENLRFPAGILVASTVNDSHGADGARGVSKRCHNISSPDSKRFERR